MSMLPVIHGADLGRTIWLTGMAYAYAGVLLWAGGYVIFARTIDSELVWDWLILGLVASAAWGLVAVGGVLYMLIGGVRHVVQAMLRARADRPVYLPDHFAPRARYERGEIEVEEFERLLELELNGSAPTGGHVSAGARRVTST